jgi:5-methylcytosine-specific restriction endonuclease McrA
MSKYTFIDACDANRLINPWQIVENLYKQGSSCNEISEMFINKYNIKVSSKHLSDYIKEKGLLRSHSERKLNAIQRGRMIYHKKPIHEKYKSGSLSANTRIKVMQRDDFKCTLCGNSPKTGATLEIHHINGNSSELDNLQTLCYLCHRGLHSVKKNS